MKKILVAILLLCMTIALASCKNTTKQTQANNDKLKVYVSFNALYEFTSAVGKDKVDISTIIPTGMEPHDFEPKAADMTGLSKARVFVYNGLGMEAWAEKMIEAAKNNSLTVVVASDSVTAIKNADEEEIQEHGQYDPHTWLSLKAAKIEVQNIANGLVKADPSNKDFYQNNATEYIKQLDALYNEYNDKFSTLSNKNFVTGHAAFHYFCEDFGLSQNSVEDVFAEGEPSTKQLAELVDYCKTNHVTTIFAEEMASPDISNTLASEVGAKVETIYTLESPEDNLSYLERMTKNCEKVYESLSK